MEHLPTVQEGGSQPREWHHMSECLMITPSAEVRPVVIIQTQSVFDQMVPIQVENR